jgi:cytochrome c oxidase subunit III
MSSPAAVEGRPAATPLVRPTGSRANGWWGMVLLIATEATLFAVLIASYFYIRFKSPAWPPDGINDPTVGRPLLNNGVLLASIVPMYLAERAVFRGRGALLRLGLLASFLLMLAYFALQLDSFWTSWHSFKPSEDTYASLVYTIVGAHWVHVGAGILLLAFVQLRAWLGHFDAERNVPVQVTALYVYFVGLLAIPVFLTSVSPAL